MVLGAALVLLAGAEIPSGRQLAYGSGSGLAQIIFAYVDRLLAAGFDGVYLDKVDEFETMGHRMRWSRSWHALPRGPKPSGRIS